MTKKKTDTMDGINIKGMGRLFLMTILFFFAGFAQAQKDTTDYSQKKKFDALEERSKTKYRFIPMPSYDPSTKWGLSAMVMANYYSNKTDTISPPSMTGINGFASNNGSWAVGIMQNYNFNQDKWRLTGRAFYASINQVLDLGGLGDANSSRLMLIANAAAKRRIIGDLFLGLGYNYSAIEYEGRDEESQIKLEQAGYVDKAKNHGLKYSLLFDTRDNIFYPYKGWYLEYYMGQNFDNKEKEGENDFLENVVDLRYFTAINKNTDHILAAHIYGRFLTGNPSNENYSFYGRSGRQIQRGYEVGSFIDRNMTSIEAEYRRETPLLKRKLGFVAFASLGKVYGDIQKFSDADWLPAVGAGVRYRFLDYERMNFKADAAYGKDGWALYFGVTEAF